MILPDYRKIPGPDGHLHPFARKKNYVLWWKENRTARMIDCSRFGLFSSAQEALERVDVALRRPTNFRQRFRGGRFFALAIEDSLPVDESLFT